MNLKVIIPCHLDSVRLEQKVLININGLPMVEHVRRRALLSNKVDSVFIATGDKEIKNIIINDVILENQNNSVKEYLKELRNKYQIEILADLNEISD